MAEEEGQARVALYDAGEADLLAGLAVVVADSRDGKATGVGWPRGVDKDAVGLAAPADEAQVLAHEAALGVLAAEVGQALADPLGGHPGPGVEEPRVGELPPVPGVAVGEAGEHVERQQRPHRVGLGVAARVGAGHQPARAQERVQQERVAERHGERRASGAGVAPPRPLDALRRGPELARRQVVGEQAPGLAPARPAHPVHDPTQARTALPHGPGAVPADLTAVARSLPPATSWLTYMPTSCGISESPLPHDTRCGRRTQATDKVFQQLGAGSRGRGRLGSASGGLRKCREVRVSELAREHCGSQIGIAVVDHVI